VTRDAILEFGIYTMFFILLCGFMNIQIIQGDRYRVMSENNRIRTIPIVAARGRIYDRNGVILADNKQIFNVSIIADDFDLSHCVRLSAILDEEPSDVSKTIKKLKKSPRASTPVIIKKDVNRTALYHLEELSTLVGGLLITEDSLRYYPESYDACHVVGYIGKINQKEYAKHKHEGWLINDYIGRLGVERTCNEQLMGTRGGRQIEVNAKGQKLRILSERDPELGRNIHLTLDVKLQARLLQLLDKQHNVSVCVMDIHSGEIISLISTPLFDPNVFLDPSRVPERMDALRHSRFPLINRPISLTYSPGSIFKLLIGVAALEEHIITPNDSINCSGVFRLNERSREFKCWNPYGHKDIQLFNAIARSCNIYFYRVGLRLGNAKIAKYARMFGFGERVHLGLPFSKAGLVPDAVWKRTKMKERWYPGETINYAIGQGFLEVTPLQVGKMISIIANDGKVLEPHIVKGVTYPVKSVPIQSKNFAIIRGAMLRAIDSEYGTGHLAQPKYFKAAGKTGTAQTFGEPHSWYAGYFPYNDPKIALVVLVEHGGVGGIVAATYAGKMADEWLAYTDEQTLGNQRNAA